MLFSHSVIKAVVAVKARSESMLADSEGMSFPSLSITLLMEIEVGLYPDTAVFLGPKQ